MSEAMEKAWAAFRSETPTNNQPMMRKAFHAGWDAAQAVSLPDRETLAKVALKTYNEWANLSPLKQMSFGYPSLGELIADAVLVALSTQPAAVDCEGTCDYYGGVCVTCGRAQPTELAELFPGTLAALDHLSIRPEVQ